MRNHEKGGTLYPMEDKDGWIVWCIACKCTHSGKDISKLNVGQCMHQFKGQEWMSLNAFLWDPKYVYERALEIRHSCAHTDSNKAITRLDVKRVIACINCIVLDDPAQHPRMINPKLWFCALRDGMMNG